MIVKRPSVIMVIGKVMSSTIGRMIALTMPKMTAAISAVPNE